MGKKSRAKRQREKKSVSPTQTGQSVFRLGTQSESILNSPVPETAKETPAAVSPFADHDDYIRTDIRRILLLLLIVVSLLITSFIIDYRTSLIDRVGTKFASFLDLNGN